MFTIPNNKKQNGFTMIELALVVAMIGVISVSSSSLASSFLWRSDLSGGGEITVASLRRAQVLAKAQSNDTDWGVHIEDNLLTIFAGADFNSRDISFDEEYDLGSVTTGSPVDIVYSKFSGIPSSPLNITLVAAEETIVINVNTEGAINY